MKARIIKTPYDTRGLTAVNVKLEPCTHPNNDWSKPPILDCIEIATLSTGELCIIWPRKLSAEDYADIKDLLAIVERKMGRMVTPPAETIEKEEPTMGEEKS